MMNQNELFLFFGTLQIDISADCHLICFPFQGVPKGAPCVCTYFAKRASSYAHKSRFCLRLWRREQSILILPYPAPTDCRRPVQEAVCRCQSAIRPPAGSHGTVRQKQLVRQLGRFFYLTYHNCASRSILVMDLSGFLFFVNRPLSILYLLFQENGSRSVRLLVTLTEIDV
ncbi:hypothetical protein SDC9_97964 [bioreactor metagenome]|uniref:Uncharacterized protein n=1 Tax=bioreactor metagenome TaxID=1076179 RepID=A0A645AE31_9ZZZZ